MKLTIVLDNIRSAWNVGAIMRTCDALQADLILVGYTPKPIGKMLKLISKTAIGAENWVSWQGFDLAPQVLASYPNAQHFGIEISDKSQNIFDYLAPSKASKKLFTQDIFLWFGNEIHGLSPELVTQMQAELHLPMKGKKESLNVASTVCTCGYIFWQAKEIVTTLNNKGWLGE